MSAAGRAQELLRRGANKLDLSRCADRDGLLDGCLKLLQMLQKWNRVWPLVSPGSPEQWVARHLLDSLALVPHFHRELAALIGAGKADTTSGSDATPYHWLDVGSGAGFPGLVLAMALPAWNGSLVDSRRRPCSFMLQAVLELGLDNVEVIRDRVERISDRTWPLITARGVAPPDRLLSLVNKALTPGGRVLLPVAEDPGKAPSLPEQWSVQRSIRLSVPGLDAPRHLLILAAED